MPGDADRREQRADRGRDQRDEQRDQDGLRERRAGVDRERPQRHDGGEERDRQPGEQDVERDLVRRLAALGALDERDHAVEERLARLLRDLDHEPVGEQPRAAGDGRAVAAGLADHRRGLAGDRRLVDRADALDDLAVGGDDLARLDDDDVAALELGRGHLLERRRCPTAGARSSSCASRAARSPAPCRGPRRSPRRSSRTARSARARPRSRRRTRAAPCRPRTRSRKKIAVVITLPSSTMNMTGLRNWRPRVELRERVARSPRATMSREKMLARAACHQRPLLVEREVELEHVHAGLAEEAERAPVGVLVDQLLRRARERQAAHRRRRARTAARAYAGEMCGSMPEPEVVTASTGMSPIVRPGLYGRSSFRIAARRAPARSSRGRGSSGRGSRRSSPPRCRRARSRTAAGGSTAAS